MIITTIFIERRTLSRIHPNFHIQNPRILLLDKWLEYVFVAYPCIRFLKHPYGTWARLCKYFSFSKIFIWPSFDHQLTLNPSSQKQLCYIKSLSAKHAFQWNTYLSANVVVFPRRTHPLIHIHFILKINLLCEFLRCGRDEIKIF